MGGVSLFNARHVTMRAHLRLCMALRFAQKSSGFSLCVGERRRGWLRASASDFNLKIASRNAAAATERRHRCIRLLITTAL
jgi:hypothetical protein